MSREPITCPGHDANTDCEDYGPEGTCTACDAAEDQREHDMDERYDIIRMFFSDDHDTFVVKRGVTLEEAQAHCHDPETSASTATSDWAKAYTAKYGPWFDGYEEVGRTRQARRAPVLT